MQFLHKIFAILFAIQSLSAQSDQSSSQALLWKIESDKSTTSSYLFGTIHLIPAEEYFLPAGLENALSKVNKLYFEIDIDVMNNPATMLGLMDKLFMNNDTSLTDLLTKDEYNKVNTYFEKMGMPLAFLERLKPLFLSALAGTEGNPFALKDGSFKSYEMELSKMAKDKKIDVEGLETVDFQISIFDSIPYTVQAKMLLESITAEQQDDSQMKQMYQHYRQQNLDALNQSITKEDQQLTPYLEMMLFNRNKNWIPIMVDAMQKSPSLFAVGAGHLPGELGVIQLLRNAGFKLTPVK